MWQSSSIWYLKKANICFDKLCVIWTQPRYKFIYLNLDYSDVLFPYCQITSIEKSIWRVLEFVSASLYVWCCSAHYLTPECLICKKSTILVNEFQNIQLWVLKTFKLTTPNVTQGDMKQIRKEDGTKVWVGGSLAFSTSANPSLWENWTKHRTQSKLELV